MEELKTGKIDCAIWMVTYNHAAYIRQAIDSVLAQETRYRYHIFIGDDKSTDGTSDLCLEFARKYPDTITLFTHEKNIGASANGVFVYLKCLASGARYTALLEGDDFWTDSSKLEKQISLLDANPQFAGCFHDAVTINSNGELISPSFVQMKRRLTRKDVLNFGGLFPAGSLIFRTELINRFPPELKKMYGGDRLMSMAITGYGDLEYLDYNMSAYRLHNTGMYSTASVLVKSERQYHDFLFLNSISEYRTNYAEEIKKKLAENLSVMAFCYALQNRRRDQWNAALAYMRVMPWKWFDIKRLLSHVLFPVMYKKFRPDTNP